jgi:hypothetical protein
MIVAGIYASKPLQSRIWICMFFNASYRNMNFNRYHMSYKGAAGKAFSAHMPIYSAVFGSMNKDIRLLCIYPLKSISFLMTSTLPERYR